MGLFDRSVLRWLSGASRKAAAARKAELRGELDLAAELWGFAGEPAEAARVMILRGDAEPEPSRRMPHYTQAQAVARTLGESAAPLLAEATKKRAGLVVTLAEAAGAGLSAARRRELRDAGRELEAAGDPRRAAEAYRLAEDKDGEARALEQAGDVEELEHLLSSEATKERAARDRQSAHSDVDLLEASGRRREALARAEALAKELPGDRTAVDRARSLAARRAVGKTLRIVLRGGAPVTLVLGDEVVVGRTEGEIRVPSQAVSRRHVRLARAKDGHVAVADLGSRNGTQLRGMPMHGELPLESGLALTLGKEVHLAIAPSDELPGATAVEVGGQRYVAPLGPLRLPFDGLSLEPGADGWIELASREGSAFVNGVMLVPRATLLVGDKIALARGQGPVLEILGT